MHYFYFHTIIAFKKHFYQIYKKTYTQTKVAHRLRNFKSPAHFPIYDKPNQTVLKAYHFLQRIRNL